MSSESWIPKVTIYNIIRKAVKAIRRRPFPRMKKKKAQVISMIAKE